jgi:hypothetical protein
VSPAFTRSSVRSSASIRSGADFGSRSAFGALIFPPLRFFSMTFFRRSR